MKLEDYPNLKNVVYNDFNPLNVNVFNCVKNYKEFSEVIENYPSQNSEMFYKFKEELFGRNKIKVDLPDPDYHTASKYIYLITQVWSGTNVEKGKFIDLKGKYKSKFDTFKDKLQSPKWQKYFDKITHIENLDFEENIKKYDNEKTYIYNDPPYYNLGEKYYVNHEFGLETHERLAKTLQSMKGKFSLSYYYFDLLDDWYPKNKFTWESKSFKKAAAAKSGKKQSDSEELLIMNYEI
jgi:DNA adenine methylase